MIDKNKMAIPVGVAFVWFTTQFGGGFASGAQLFQYFIVYGLIGLFTPVLAQAMGAFFQWYGMRYAYRHKTFDYKSFNDSFFGKFRFIFSNLYEVLYIVLLCLAPSVAFATGGATLSQLTGINYMLCTVIIGAFIFFVTIFGTDFVRKVASTLSIMIIAGLLVVFVPNIIAQWSAIVDAIKTMASEFTWAQAGAGLWSCIIYGAFQLASIGLLMQHAEPFESDQDAKTAMVYGFIVNASMIFISTLGLLGVAKNPELIASMSDPALAKSFVPTIFMVQRGVGASVLTPIISILIILGAVSTAVNMVAGVVQRFVVAAEKKSSGDFTEKKEKFYTYLVAGLFTALAWGIAQFGLIPLVAKGYGMLGYLTIPVIIIPFIIHMIMSKKDDQRPELEEPKK